MGQHCLGIPRVLYDTLLRLGYYGGTPIYRCWLSKAHGLDMCEVSIMMPFNLMELWSRSIISNVPNTAVEMMVHVALTSKCEDRLSATAALPITILPI
jgi:hypothetical protein